MRVGVEKVCEGKRQGGGARGRKRGGAKTPLLREHQLGKDAPLPEFMRARAAAASSGEIVEASTPPLSLSSSSKDASVAPGRTYTI